MSNVVQVSNVRFVPRAKVTKRFALANRGLVMLNTQPEKVINNAATNSPTILFTVKFYR